MTKNSPGGRESTGAMSGDAGAATSSSQSLPETADVMAYALSEEERNEFAAHEQTIKQGLKSWVEVGNALVIIRDDRLYRAEHISFESYCRARWQMGRSRAYQLIEASAITAAVSTIVDTPPTNEGQARELTGLEPSVAAEVVGRAAAGTGPLTAATIREAREQIAPKPHLSEGERFDTDAALTDGLVDALERRMPGTKADLARTSLRARWSRLIAAPAEILTMDTEALAAALPAEYIPIAELTASQLVKKVAAIKAARNRGLRLVKADGTGSS